MNNMKVQHNDGTIILLNSEVINPFHYLTENGECNKSTFGNIKYSKTDETSLGQVNDFEKMFQRNQEISHMNDTLCLKNKITSLSSTISDEVKTVNQDKTRTPNDLLDSSKIYISCRFCKEGFETMTFFSSHECKKKKKNFRIKMHKCKFCSLMFSQQHFATHLKAHKRNNCTLCDAKFTKRKALCKHLRIVHNIIEPEKLHKCSICDKHFTKRLALNFHLKTHMNNRFFCLKCCFMCDDEDIYNDHMKEHIKISKYECHLCQKKFVRRQQYDQHMMAHKRHVCSSCNVTFSNKKLFLKHQHSVHHVQYEKKYACLICQKLFIRPKYLELHQRVHTGEKPVKCSHCEKNFSDSKSLLKHMKTVKHLQRVSNQKGQAVEIEKPFLCSKCGVRFYRQQSLLRHIEVNHSSTEFLKCPDCNYKSKCKTNFKRHVELHTDMKRFICEVCGLSFRALATLKEHYVFVHSENREFMCDVCKKSFKNKSTLQRHMRIHSESRPYKCFCNRDYKRMSHLKRHMVSAHQITFKKDQICMVMKENENLNHSFSEENITALIKSFETLPDESSCDDVSVSDYIMSVPNNETAMNGKFSAPEFITMIPSNHAKALSDINIYENSCEEQLPLPTENQNITVQKLPDNCDVQNMDKNSKITSNTFNFRRQLRISPTTALPNSETSSASLDDATLSLSPSNYCNTPSPLDTISVENLSFSHSIISQDEDTLTSLHNMINPKSSPNLNFYTPASNIDTFVSFSNSNSPNSLSAPPFSLNSSPSHVTDLNLEQNFSQRQLFDEPEDFLSLQSYASNDEFGENCSPKQFYIWDTDENSNASKISDNNLAIPNTCANIFSSTLTCNMNNPLPNNLFASDSVDATTANSELD